MGLNTTEITNALAGARTPRERSRMVKELASWHGCSTQTIYNKLRGTEFSSGRQRRADAGKRKLPLTDEQLSQVAALIHRSHTEKKRIPMPAFEAIRLAEESKLIPPGLLTEDYLNKWMRQREVAKADALKRTPHTHMMSLHPNHVHMIDASQCAQWYLDKDGEVAHQRRGLEVYKNKPGKGNKITRLILIDHYSGAFFVGYVQAENALEWIEFLYRAWAPKSFLAPTLTPYLGEQDLDTLFPFRGLPKLLYADKGSPIIAHNTRRVIEALNIRFETHQRHNPRAKGANETMQRHWENAFESGLKIYPAKSMEELNARAFACCLHINANRKFTRHQQTRFAFWLAHIEGHLLEVPEYRFYQSFAMSSPELKKVSMEGIVRYTPRTGYVPGNGSGYRYYVPDVNLYGTEVEVSFCIHNYPAVRIVSRKTGQVFETMPLQQDGAGFYPEIAATLGETFRSPAHTESQKALAEIKDVEVEVAPAALAPDVSDATAWETPTGSAFVMPVEAEVKTFSRLHAKKRILQHFHASRADELHIAQQSLLATLGDTITATDLDTLIAEMEAVEAATTADIYSIGGNAS